MFASIPSVLCRVVVLGLALSMLGCINAPGGVAPSNVPLEGRSYQIVGRTEGTDSSFWLLGLIPVTGSNTTDKALRDAIEKKKADALINITVDAYAQWWIVVTRYVTKVRGTAITFD